MAKYGVNYYGSSSYGSFVNLRFSVQPMSVLATELSTVSSFSKVLVEWQTPRGEFSRIRLVRNQAGFPETSEDGVIIYDEFATEGTVSRTSIIDGEDNPTDIPLVPGRQVYYRMFLFTTTLIWKVAGSITAIVPSDHGIQDKFMATIPRVFTSKSQEPLGAVDVYSDLYKFMSGLTFAQEEFFLSSNENEQLFHREHLEKIFALFKEKQMFEHELCYAFLQTTQPGLDKANLTLQQILDLEIV